MTAERSRWLKIGTYNCPVSPLFHTLGPVSMVDKNSSDDSREAATCESDTPAEDRPTEPPGSHSDWKEWLQSLRTRLREQLTVWPEQVGERLDLVDLDASTDVPEGGDVLLYVHGYLGEGRVDGMNASGANQAAALRKAIIDEVEEGEDVPTVVAGTWNSSALWSTATKRAVEAGRALASWIESNADQYDRLVLVGHSLGGRLVLTSLSGLEQATVDSVGLLGAAVDTTALRTDYRSGIEKAVADQVYNYHSANDHIVCNLYRFRENHDGIGCTGALSSDESHGSGGALPQNYVDVDVSDTVHRHMDYFKPVSNTAVGNCIPQLVAHQF